MKLPRRLIIDVIKRVQRQRTQRCDIRLAVSVDEPRDVSDVLCNESEVAPELIKRATP